MNERAIPDLERPAGREPDRATGGGDDPVGRLLVLAGRRPELAEERARRLRAAARPHWLRAVAARRRRRAAWAGLAAAAGLAVVVVGLWAGGWDRPPALPWLPAAEVTRIAGPAPTALRGDRGEHRPLAAGDRLWRGERLASGAGRAGIELRGGTAIRLDRGTRVRLLGGGELALEAGALYVDTGDGAARHRVRIRTPLGLVEDVGTRFEVRLLPDSLRLRTRDGRVVIHHDRGSYEGRDGEELTLTHDGQLTRTALARHGEPWAWTLQVAAVPDLDGRELEELLAWASRETGLTLRFAPGARQRATAGARIHGELGDLPALEALDAALSVCGLRYRSEGGELIIEEPPAAPSAGGSRAR